MAYWVKINYDKNEYIINFERVSAFCYEQNGRTTLWLPDSAIPIVVNPSSDLDAYQKIMGYIQQVTKLDFEAYWVKIYYERNEYLINLNSIGCFRHEPNGRITFWLPDSSIPIIISPQSNPESYQKVVDYIQKTTGHSLS